MKFKVESWRVIECEITKERPFIIEIDNYEELVNYGYTKEQIEEIKSIKVNETKTIELFDIVYQEFTKKD